MEVLFDDEVFDPSELCGIREAVRAGLRRPDPVSDRSVADEHEAFVVIVIGELLTNAMRHGAPPYWLTVAVEDEDTKVIVHDGSADLPARRDRRPEEEIGGFGLNVVAQIARTWGSASYDGGKRVWAAIPRDMSSFPAPGLRAW